MGQKIGKMSPIIKKSCYLRIDVETRRRAQIQPVRARKSSPQTNIPPPLSASANANRELSNGNSITNFSFTSPNTVNSLGRPHSRSDIPIATGNGQSEKTSSAAAAEKWARGSWDSPGRIDGKKRTETMSPRFRSDGDDNSYEAVLAKLKGMNATSLYLNGGGSKMTASTNGGIVIGGSPATNVNDSLLPSASQNYFINANNGHNTTHIKDSPNPVNKTNIRDDSYFRESAQTPNLNFAPVPRLGGSSVDDLRADLHERRSKSSQVSTVSKPIRHNKSIEILFPPPSPHTKRAQENAPFDGVSLSPRTLVRAERRTPMIITTPLANNKQKTVSPRYQRPLSPNRPASQLWDGTHRADKDLYRSNNLTRFFFIIGSRFFSFFGLFIFLFV